MMRTPTPEQQAILQAAADGHDLIKVSALAGTGKTSTTEWLTGVPYRRGGGQLYSQFAVAGGEDAARRLAGSGAIVKRPGQLAWAAAAQWQQDRLKEGRVTSAEVAKRIGVNERALMDATMATSAADWVGLMRKTVLNFCQDDEQVVLRDHVPAKVAERDVEAMIKAAQWLWNTQLCGKEGAVSFTMDHLKKHWSLACPQYSYGRIMLDEAQDSNPCDLHVYSSQDTQLVVIGDPWQQIYEWRGAVNALSEKALPGGIWLSLTGSFRFGPEIAAEANRYLAMLGAPEPVRGLGQPGWVGPLNGQADAVLCRTNAEGMQVAIDSLRAGRSVSLAGKTRDDLLRLANGAMALRNGRRTEHPDLIGFRSWADFRRYAETDLDGQDYLTLVRLVDAHGEGLVDYLKAMTDDPGADVTIATVWKAKGLEWGSVRVADDFWPGEGGALNEKKGRWWLSGERRAPFLRVCYVAVTRAKMGLDASSLSWMQDPRFLRSDGERG